MRIFLTLIILLLPVFAQDGLASLYKSAFETQEVTTSKFLEQESFRSAIISNFNALLTQLSQPQQDLILDNAMQEFSFIRREVIKKELQMNNSKSADLHSLDANTLKSYVLLLSSVQALRTPANSEQMEKLKELHDQIFTKKSDQQTVVNFSGGVNLLKNTYELFVKHHQAGNISAEEFRAWMRIAVPYLFKYETQETPLVVDGKFQEIVKAISPFLEKSLEVFFHDIQFKGESALQDTTQLGLWFPYNEPKNSIGFHPVFFLTLENNKKFQDIIASGKDDSLSAKAMLSYMEWLATFSRKDETIISFLFRVAWKNAEATLPGKEIPTFLAKETPTTPVYWQRVIQTVIFGLEENWPKVFSIIDIALLGKQWKNNFYQERIQLTTHAVDYLFEISKNTQNDLKLLSLREWKLRKDSNKQFAEDFRKILFPHTSKLVFDNPYAIFEFSPTEYNSLIMIANSLHTLENKAFLAARNFLSILALRIPQLSELAWKTLADQQQTPQTKRTMSLLFEGFAYREIKPQEVDNIFARWKKDKNLSDTLLLLYIGDHRYEGQQLVKHIFPETSSIKTLIENSSERKAEVYDAVANFIIRDIQQRSFRDDTFSRFKVLCELDAPPGALWSTQKLNLEIAQIYWMKIGGVGLEQEGVLGLVDNILSSQQNFTKPYFDTWIAFRGLLKISTAQVSRSFEDSEPSLFTELKLISEHSISELDLRSQSFFHLFWILNYSREGDRLFRKGKELSDAGKHYKNAINKGPVLLDSFDRFEKKNKIFGEYGKSLRAFNYHLVQSLQKRAQLEVKRCEIKQKYLEKGFNFHGVNPNMFPSLQWENYRLAAKLEIDHLKEIRTKIEKQKADNLRDIVNKHSELIQETQEQAQSKLKVEKAIHLRQQAFFEEEAAKFAVEARSQELEAMQIMHSVVKKAKEAAEINVTLAEKSLEISKIEKSRLELATKVQVLDINIQEFNTEIAELEGEYQEKESYKKKYERLAAQAEKLRVHETQKQSFQIKEQYQQQLEQHQRELQLLQGELESRQKVLTSLGQLFSLIIKEIDEEVRNLREKHDNVQDARVKTLIERTTIIGWQLAKKFLESPFLNTQQNKLVADLEQLIREKKKNSSAQANAVSSFRSNSDPIFQELSSDAIENTVFEGISLQELHKKFPEVIDFTRDYERNMLRNTIKQFMTQVVAEDFSADMETQVKRELLLTTNEEQNYIGNYLKFITRNIEKRISFKKSMDDEALKKAVLFSLSNKYATVLEKEIHKIAMKYIEEKWDTAEGKIENDLRALFGSSESLQQEIQKWLGIVQQQFFADESQQLLQNSLQSLVKSFQCNIAGLMSVANIDELERKVNSVKQSLNEKKKTLETQQNEQISKIESKIAAQIAEITELKDKIQKQDVDYKQATLLYFQGIQNLKSAEIGEQQAQLGVLISQIKKKRESIEAEKRKIFLEMEKENQKIGETKIEQDELTIEIRKLELEMAQQQAENIAKKIEVAKTRVAEAEKQKESLSKKIDAAKVQVEIQSLEVAQQEERQAFNHVVKSIPTKIKPLISIDDLHRIQEKSEARLQFYLTAMRRIIELTTDKKLLLEKDEPAKENYNELIFQELKSKSHLRIGVFILDLHIENKKNRDLLHQLVKTGKISFSIDEIKAQNPFDKNRSVETLSMKNPSILSVDPIFSIRENTETFGFTTVSFRPKGVIQPKPIEDKLQRKTIGVETTFASAVRKDGNFVRLEDIESLSQKTSTIEKNLSESNFIFRSPIGEWSIKIDPARDHQQITRAAFIIYYTYFVE
ncbi:hypothetical protein [Candidatus Uabimicrobium amorphum]|uniref:Uncharacterized protein n=1 Tax=Uabimicrobium amorphum TaxID=2596890 RepID=A0A5S9IQD6_UABAM|nr:hypothetical protein [Candidatus Uabimicrobium amorphum]BBM86149.1 hypothetical protein UABAM_04535 [Candidatus Uabimicrobium amorphum]